ncbi:MAG: TetR/AcrR family transcriptional regulator, partial [Myxococcota bacterium]
MARRVGVTHAAPYRHFKHKAALLAAVAEAGFRDLAAVVSQLRLSDAEREARDDGKGGLVSCGVRYLRFAAAHPARFQVMFGADLAEPRTVALRDAGGAMLD